MHGRATGEGLIAIPGFTLYEHMDALRRQQGRFLDALGLGPRESAYETVLTRPGLALRRYGEGTPSGGAPVLVVPAPIKGSSIWDLAPEISALRRLLDAGLAVYLVHWVPPGEAGGSHGLADYAGPMLADCLEVIREQTGQDRAFLLAHSLGGTLATLFAALHPGRVRGLALLASPLRFGPDVGLFGPLAAGAGAPRATGNVPGSLLNALSLWASPATFATARWLDWLGSQGDPVARRTHLLVERWTLDEMPMAQGLFRDLTQALYRDDRFIKGTLTLAGRAVRPAQVSAPLLGVVDRRCPLVPPESVQAFHRAAGSKDITLLWYSGDVGVSLQHVGMLVGRNAHRGLWPRIVAWLRAH